MLPLPLQFLLFMLASWVNRHQQQDIDYLKSENAALREQLGGKRPRFVNDAADVESVIDIVATPNRSACKVFRTKCIPHKWRFSKSPSDETRYARLGIEFS
jgi:hypothetical protein